MGAIQQAVNAGLSTAALAVGGAKSLKEKKQENILKEQEQKVEAGIKSAQLAEEIAEGKEKIKANKAIAKAVKKSGIIPETAEYDPVSKEVTGVLDLFDDIEGRNYNIKKLRMANQTLKANLKAKKAQREIYQQILQILGGKK